MKKVFVITESVDGIHVGASAFKKHKSAMKWIKLIRKEYKKNNNGKMPADVRLCTWELNVR